MEMDTLLLSQQNNYRNIFIIGAGHVVKERWWPALLEISKKYIIDTISIFSLESVCKLEGRDFLYKQIYNLSDIPNRNIDDTLVIIACPPEYHVDYIKYFYTSNCRIAVEKPLSMSFDSLRDLCYSKMNNVYPVDHKLFSLSFIDFLLSIRTEELGRIESTFFQSLLIPSDRYQINSVYDIQWHLLTLLLSISKKFNLNILDINGNLYTSRYIYNHVISPEITASRIQGIIKGLHNNYVEFDLKQCEGSGRIMKHTILFNKKGGIINTIDLMETGYMQHYRLLFELLSSDSNKLNQSQKHAFLVQRYLDGLLKRQNVEPNYTFNSIPAFLK